MVRWRCVRNRSTHFLFEPQIAADLYETCVDRSIWNVVFTRHGTDPLDFCSWGHVSIFFPSGLWHLIGGLELLVRRSREHPITAGCSSAFVFRSDLRAPHGRPPPEVDCFGISSQETPCCTPCAPSPDLLQDPSSLKLLCWETNPRRTFFSFLGWVYSESSLNLPVERSSLTQMDFRLHISIPALACMWKPQHRQTNKYFYDLEWGWSLHSSVVLNIL